MTAQTRGNDPLTAAKCPHFPVWLSGLRVAGSHMHGVGGFLGLESKNPEPRLGQ